MINSNKISAVLSDADKTATLGLLEQAKTNMPFLIQHSICTENEESNHFGRTRAILSIIEKSVTSLKNNLAYLTSSNLTELRKSKKGA